MISSSFPINHSSVNYIGSTIKIYPFQTMSHLLALPLWSRSSLSLAWTPVIISSQVFLSPVSHSLLTMQQAKCSFKNSMPLHHLWNQFGIPVWTYKALHNLTPNCLLYIICSPPYSFHFHHTGFFFSPLLYIPSSLPSPGFSTCCSLCLACSFMSLYG